MLVVWLVIILVGAFLVYKIVRGLVLTAKCKRIFKMQQKRLEEEGMVSKEILEEDIGDD